MVGRAWQPGCLWHMAETSRFLADGNAESLGTSESVPRDLLLPQHPEESFCSRNKASSWEPVLNCIALSHMPIHRPGKLIGQAQMFPFGSEVRSASSVPEDSGEMEENP